MAYFRAECIPDYKLQLHGTGDWHIKWRGCQRLWE
jgi:hypothetical protein